MTYRPTILQIIPTLNSGGAEMDTLTLTRALMRAEAQPLIATEGGRMNEDCRQAGGEIINFPAATKNPVRILANAHALKRVMQLHNVDLIHARSRAPAWSALLATRKAGIPFVTTCHGSHGNRGRLRKAYSRVMGRGDRVIAVSQYSADFIRAQYGTPPTRLRTIYRGIDLNRFNPSLISPERLSRIRTLWRVKETQPIVLHAARLTRLKGHRTLIEAVAQLFAQGGLGDTIVILAGEAAARDAYREELEQGIAAAKMEDHIRLVGYCDDMPAAFSLAHVSVVASTRAETFGLVSAEAQAMCCPVIATDLGANPETLIPSLDKNYTGWLCPPSDASALSERLATALALSTRERKAIGMRARAHALARFSEESMQRATLAVYDELLGTKLVETFDHSSR